MIKQTPVSPGQGHRAPGQSLLTKLMSQEIRNFLRKFSGCGRDMKWMVHDWQCSL